MENIKFGGLSIEYSVERSPNRKTVAIIVDPEQGVVVKSPLILEDDKIIKMVRKKAPWIKEKLREVERIGDSPPESEFVSGESLTYLGRNYRLKVRRIEALDKVKLIGNRFNVEIPEGLSREVERKRIRELLAEWYMKHARERIQERVNWYAPKLDVVPKDIIIKEQGKRWGSCTTKGVVNFNWRVIMAPMSIVDYVVVHELCHLRSPNHSIEYWEIFASVLPDYSERRNWLKRYGGTLRLD